MERTGTSAKLSWDQVSAFSWAKCTQFLDSWYKVLEIEGNLEML